MVNNCPTGMPVNIGYCNIGISYIYIYVYIYTYIVYEHVVGIFAGVYISLQNPQRLPDDEHGEDERQVNRPQGSFLHQ